MPGPRKIPWSPLTHAVYRLWSRRALDLRGELIVGWSGGADSTMLLHVLAEVAGAAGLRLHAVTVHHGPGPWKDDRDRAVEHCRRESVGQSWSWECVVSSRALKSEAELRAFRRTALLKILHERGAVGIALAHHADDLLETRLMRLMRGTGARGLKAMTEWRRPWLRPFLGIPRAEVRAELVHRGLTWVEDPSNQDLRPFRNWIRGELLPLVQRRDAALLRGMSRSLEELARSLTPDGEEIPTRVLRDGALVRREFMLLSPKMKQLVLGRYLRTLAVENFRLSQVQEALRHLDKVQIVHSFQTASCRWQVNAERILALPLRSTLAGKNRTLAERRTAEESAEGTDESTEGAKPRGNGRD